MKEIKFRAWDGVRMRYDGFWVSPTGDGFWENREYEQGQKHFPYTLQQFTGLYDTNGKEICEGDIVREWYSIGVIEYEESRAAYRGEFQWQMHSNGKIENRADKFYSPPTKDLEVIGNIYENPELLTS